MHECHGCFPVSSLLPDTMCHSLDQETQYHTGLSPYMDQARNTARHLLLSLHPFPSPLLPSLVSPTHSRNILSAAKANSIIQSDFLHKTCQSIHQATPTSTPTISVWLACIFRIWDGRESIITSWNSLPVVYYINIKNIGFISN